MATHSGVFPYESSCDTNELRIYEMAAPSNYVLFRVKPFLLSHNDYQ
jgi:hypothetical protein